MGHYIEVPRGKNKAAQLKILYNAEILTRIPSTWESIPADKALICVVDNGAWEAAGLCMDKDDYQRFDAVDDTGPFKNGKGGVYTLRGEAQERGEQRPRTWVLLEKKLAFELAGVSDFL